MLAVGHQFGVAHGVLDIPALWLSLRMHGTAAIKSNAEVSVLPWSPFSESGGRSFWHLAMFVFHYSPMTFTITRLSRCPSNSA
jgi:hypothetical protein